MPTHYYYSNAQTFLPITAELNRGSTYISIQTELVRLVHLDVLSATTWILAS
jgi:hypothetical protein